MMAKELADNLHQAVKRHCANGDELANVGKFHDAIAEYNKAWALLPGPRDGWDAATWVLAAIGEAAISGGYTDLAKQAFDDVMACPGAIGNAFLHLRRGQLLFDAGNLDAAADELMGAYMDGGGKIFEAEAPKYLEFLETRAAI